MSNIDFLLYLFTCEALDLHAAASSSNWSLSVVEEEVVVSGGSGGHVAVEEETLSEQESVSGMIRV